MSLTLDLLNLAIAVGCVWATLPEIQGKPVKLWRLGLPPVPAVAVEIILLAGTPGSHVLSGGWLAAAILGGIAGAAVGRRVRSETDHMWGLVRLRPTYVGATAAACVLAMVLVDLQTALLGYPPSPADRIPSVGGALFAGVLLGRLWTIAARASRGSHVELSDV